jgi:hypothetical protein
MIHKMHSCVSQFAGFPKTRGAPDVIEPGCASPRPRTDAVVETMSEFRRMTSPLVILVLQTGACATGEVSEARLCGLSSCVAASGASGDGGTAGAGIAGTASQLGGAGTGGTVGAIAGERSVAGSGGMAGSGGTGNGYAGSAGSGSSVAGNGGVGGSVAGSGGSSGNGGMGGSAAGSGGSSGMGGAAAVDLTSGAVAFADSEETSKGNIAPNGNDANNGTRWCAADGALGHSWGIDLGQTHQVNNSQITFEFDGRTYGYVLEGSTTSQAAGYTTLVDRTTNVKTTQIQSETFTGTARYVRVRFVALPANSWACVDELKLLGK